MPFRLQNTRWLTGALVLVLAVVFLFFTIDLEPRWEPQPAAVPVSQEALRIHREAIVIDLHVDSLLWPRDLHRSGAGGQVDLPRMREGGLDAAAFTIATRFFGVAGLKALHDGWPVGTWFSAAERFDFQLARMDRLLEAGSGTIRRAATSSSIRENHRRGRLSVFHGIEGAHALGADPSRVSEAARRWVVFIAPVHLSDNEYGGSSSGSDRGLTALGRELIERMNQERLLVDLAHAGATTFDEALALTRLPPIVSHAGARAVHDTWRNLSDAQIRAVAGRGGVIGVMLAPPALAESDLREAFAHLEHVIEVGGEDAAALGSDFDGYVRTPIDAAGLPQLTELMLRAGWTEERIRKVLGENVLRVLDARSSAAEPASSRRPSARRVSGAFAGRGGLLSSGPHS